MDEKLLLKVETAADRLSIGRSKAWELVSAGELRTVRIGRSVRVPATEVEAFVARLAETGTRSVA